MSNILPKIYVHHELPKVGRKTPDIIANFTSPAMQHHIDGSVDLAYQSALWYPVLLAGITGCWVEWTETGTGNRFNP